MLYSYIDALQCSKEQYILDFSNCSRCIVISLTHVSKRETLIKVWEWEWNSHTLGQIITSWEKLVAIGCAEGIANKFFIRNSFPTAKDNTQDQKYVNTCGSTLDASAAAHWVSS